MQLVVTIDAEEDQWGPSPYNGSTVTNIGKIPELQRVFEEYRVVPTYLLTYPVAADPKTSAIFRELQAAGQCEIGMHCHPWNTPPYEESINRYNSMLCNLPASLQLKKVQRLYEMVSTQIGTAPLAFRSGRWGFGCETARILARLGCLIDTSITPYTSWTDSYGPDFSRYTPRAFTFSGDDISSDASHGNLVEIPVTIGYVGGNSSQCHRLSEKLKQPPFRQLRVAGMLARLGLLRSVWLSPERETSARLVKLLKQLIREGCTTVNLFFHSSALQVGCTPFVRTQQQKEHLLVTLRAVLTFCRQVGITSVPFSQAAEKILRTQSNA